MPACDPPAARIELEGGPEMWSVLLQSGVRINCTVGIPLARLLREGLELSDEALRGVDVIMLDGKPVDEPDKAVVPNGGRIALAAGVPGMAGLAVKSGSPVRGLRPGITYCETKKENPSSGEIFLALFGLAQRMLAGFFLRRGVVMTAEQVRRYLRSSLPGEGGMNGERMNTEGMLTRLAALPPQSLVEVCVL